MKTSKTYKRALAVLLALVMMFALLQTAMATRINDFPLLAINKVDLVADEDTLYIAEFRQNPTTKLITATFIVKNGNTLKPLIINGVAIEVTFDDRVSPYEPSDSAYDATRKYVGACTIDTSVFKKYCNTPLDNLKTIGSNAVQNDATARYIGTSITTEADSIKVEVAPGASVTIANLYFMPSNGTDTMDIDMFKFQFTNIGPYYPQKMTKLSTWIGNGTYFMYPTDTVGKTPALTSETYVVSPESFKLHMIFPLPNVSANNTTRTITGYDTATMEWSYDAAGPFTSGTPVVKSEAHTIYVRGKGDTGYSGNDEVYGDYKMYLQGTEVASVAFTAGSGKEQMADPSVKKTGVNQTSTDGKTRVGDVIKYTITVSNVGKDGSILVDAKMSDYINEYVTLNANSVINANGSFSYDQNTRLLTANLGNIQKGEIKTVTFDVTVGANAYGRDIANSVTITGKDGNDSDADELEKTVKEDGDERKVEGEKSGQPTVNPITEGDTTISGLGVPGAVINVTLPGRADDLTTTVRADATWSVDVPAANIPAAGQKVIVAQTETGKGASDPVEVIVASASTGNTVVVTFNPNGGTISGATTKTVTVGQPYGTLPTATRGGNYYFDGWYTSPNSSGTLVWSTTTVTNSANHTLYAHWYYMDDLNTRFTVTFYSNYPPEYVVATISNIAPGSSIGSSGMPANPARTGYAFTGWNTSMTGGGTNFTGATIVNSNTRVYAQWRGSDDVIIQPTDPPLEGFLSDHVVYIQGYPDHSMKPDQPITRAEVATIFFRLLSDTNKNTPRVSAFYDVPNGSWFTQAVSYLASREVLLGYPDGSFRPNQPITRAEFATVASRFDNLATTQTNAFPDVQGHWAMQYINSAYAKGWVSGYPDGTFKPQQNITRAETVTVVNKMLDRRVRVENIPGDATRFTDINGHWAYADIMEASNAHDYVRRTDGYETWVLK